MKSNIPLRFLILQLFFLACNSGDQNNSSGKSENDIDAARNFIQSALAGDYKKAKTFLLHDSINQQYIDAFERNYNERMSPEDKKGYRESSINIHLVKPLNDSMTIVNYSNSYKNKNDSLKVIRSNGQWLVDLKYFYYQQPDSFP